jgi:hypothetical protein
MDNNNANEGDQNPNLNEENQPEPVVVNEQDAQVQQLIQDQVREQVQQLMQQQAQVGQQVVLKSLSKWATRGLDLSEAGFSKLHSQEQKYNDDKPKYNLEPDKFEIWKNELIEKVNRMHSVGVFTGVDDRNIDRYILKEYTLLTELNVEDMRALTWPDTQPVFANQTAADDFTDKQIKSSCVASYIHASLSETAKKQLRAQQDLFTVTDFNGNEYFDGPSYFFYIADLVDPDNSHMIENVRKQLRNLDVKHFGFSIIKMLAEFKLLMQKIDELGGRYDEEDQFLDFWDCLKTMKEKEFSRYVRQEKDSYRKLARVDRGHIETYIRDMSRKEVSMKEDSEWNVMSVEDTMVMALVSALESSNKGKKEKKKEKSKSKSNDKKDSSDDKKELTDEEKLKRKEAKIPDWKKQAPKKGESKTMVKDGKTYHHCMKCRGGKGLWALHKESDHRDNFKPASSQSNKKKDGGKEVSFSTDTKQSDDEPSIQVNKQLLTNAKAYLAQFNKDFH